MKLYFSLLIVDDNPDSFRQAIDSLRDHLDTKGFDLVETPVMDFSESSLSEVTENQGKNFDLVAIDYNLGTMDTDGAKVAHHLRQRLPYTDMVFYSSNSMVDLLRELADLGVSGIFVETRDTLDEALMRLADTVIGKAVDLNHMRGIAMAEVAEMDVLMKETLISVFWSEDGEIQQISERTKKRLMQYTKGKLSRIESKLQDGGLVDIIQDSKLFTLADKYHAIMRLRRSIPGQAEEQFNKLRRYGEEIIKERNILAHAKEEGTGSGVATLRSTDKDGGEVDIDDDWMQEYRRKLRVHREALEEVCSALRKKFDPLSTIGDPR